MRNLTLASLLLGTALAGTAGVSPAHATLILCGVADGSAGDLHSGVGIVRAVCNTETGSFDGTAEEFNVENFDLIRVRGELRGSGSFEVSNIYNVGAWVGNGGELAFANGSYHGPQLGGGEFLTVTATASTFDNNSATATPLIQANFSHSNVRFGLFSGQGTLTAGLSWDAGDGVLDLGHTGDFSIGVPEPATWALLLLGFGAAGAMLRRDRRRVSRVVTPLVTKRA